jgi:hypothetical protein
MTLFLRTARFQRASPEVIRRAHEARWKRAVREI